VIRVYNYVRLVRDITPTGLGALELKEKSLELYPNPVSDVLTIAYEGDHSKTNTIEIYNAQGRIVYKKAVQPAAGFSVTLNDFLPGLYIVLVKHTTFISSGTFLKI